MIRRRLILPTALALTLLGTYAGPAAANTTVSVIGCHFVSGGSLSIAPGGVVLRNGWSATNRGLIENFLQGSEWILIVDDVEVDVAEWLGEPEQQSDGTWSVFWSYPAGSLDSGDSIEVSLELLLKHRMYDGQGFSGPGSFFGGPIYCTISAT